MWRKIRIAVLLFVLATVAHEAWQSERDLEWGRNFYVALHPINAGGSPQVDAYIATLKQEQFQSLTEYFAAEAQRYGLQMYQPFAIRLGSPVRSHPPLPPRSASTLDALLWSLKFRWWAWRHSPDMPVQPKIRLYLLYHPPAKNTPLSHSTALSKGRIGLVHLFGDAGAEVQNRVVIAHELLHTVGASDKYDLATNQPRYPEGYAEPEREPRFPQRKAELMGGRIPLSAVTSEIPRDLEATLIGPETAREIQWIKER